MPSSNFLCFGHRGAMGHAPENTLLSITKALSLGCQWIEIDVYFVDGHLMVIHDANLERTTNGTGLVINNKFDYLRRLDAGKGERIPTLDEVFDIVDRQAGINVELKGPGTDAPMVDFLKSRIKTGWRYDQIMVSAFDHRKLKTVKEAAPDIQIGALLAGIPVDNAAFGSRVSAYSVNMAHDLLDKVFVDDAHKRDLKVFAYTVNHPEDISRMRGLGIDGVFTDYPERVLDS